MRYHKQDNSELLPNRRFAWVAPDTAKLGDSMDAHSFVFAIFGSGEWLPLKRLGGKVRDGWRAFQREAELPSLYRPSHIEKMLLTPALGQMASVGGNQHAVGPGDVVISKFLPLRAAWVTQATPRHPIDSNCVRIVGLDMGAGFWVASLLNHSGFSASWERQARGKTIARIGLREINSLRIPAIPPEVKGFAVLWQDLESKRFAAFDELRSLRSDVEAIAGEGAEALPGLGIEEIRGYFPAAHLDRDWLPAHVKLRAYQTKVAERGWSRLAERLTGNGQRMRGAIPEQGRLLRLSDAEAELGFRLPALAPLTTPGFRIYAEPLQPDEVLLSLLGSSPKVVFNHPVSDDVIWVSDHWMRLRPQSSPGALAALLLSRPVQWQLGQASSGIVRQFITQEDVADIRIPRMEAAKASSVHRKLCVILEELASVRLEQEKVRGQVNLLIDQQVGRNR